MTPLTQRRLVQFKANRRGYVSFWIFLFLFFTTLFAEFIANDKPLLLKYDNHYASLFLRNIPKKHLGETLKQKLTIVILLCEI